MEPHPSASSFLTASLQTAQADPAYTLMARNFFGEVADFFLLEGDYTSLRSQPVMNNNMTFASGTYGARLKLYRSCDGTKAFTNTYDAFGGVGGASAYGKLGGRYMTASISNTAAPPTRDDFASGSVYPLPQDPDSPLEDQDYRENYTMYSRPSAFGPPVSGRRFSANVGDGFRSGSVRGVKDSFNGFNWSFTPPYYNGEAWVDFIFRPDSNRTYTLQEVLDNMDTYYWRADPGPVVESPAGDGAHPAFISASYTYRNIYDGYNVNMHAMQISASINLFGIESTLFQETDQYGNVETARNESKHTQWVIKPKFETPMMNFNSKTRAVSVANSTLSIPNFGSGTVPRGMWHQFGVLEPDPAKGIFMQIGDIPKSWLKYHYLVNTSASLYNEYSTARHKVAGAKRMRSLTDVFNFDTEGKRLGQVANETVVKEAVVAIPYITVASTAEACAEGPATEPSPGATLRKKFFSIPKERVEAALRRNANSEAGSSQEIAGESIRKLIAKMDNYVLPPQFDFLRNPVIEPTVMYIFEFSYTFDKDDLSYIWQNLAPRNYKKVTFEEQSIAHNLNRTQLLSAQDLMTHNVRWMIFKVKQRATGDYYSHIPTQAGGALTMHAVEQFNPSVGNKLGQPFGSQPIATEEYKLQYNWPYDFLSFVEGVKVDVEVLYDDESNRTRSLVREMRAKEAFAEGPTFRSSIDPQEAAEAMYENEVTFQVPDNMQRAESPRQLGGASVTINNPLTRKQGRLPNQLSEGNTTTPFVRKKKNDY